MKMKIIGILIFLIAIHHNAYSQKSGGKCVCDTTNFVLSHYTDLVLSNNGTKFSVDSLQKWYNNPERLKIKSITLIDFDTIPNAMGLFENVERISIEGINRHNPKGLDNFPKLKVLEIEEGRIELTGTEKWPGRIEVLAANKTKFIGIKSFTAMPNLKKVVISFSGFDVFPKDFESMKYLTHFQSEAHTFGKVNLNEMHLELMPCLRFFSIHSWNDNVTGIPSGMERVKTIQIQHGKLKNKEKLKKHKSNQ